LIDYEASSGFMRLSHTEVYRVNRIRLAKEFHIDPRVIDEWDAQTYYDALEVTAADNELAKLR
jgi:hypothetical protein